MHDVPKIIFIYTNGSTKQKRWIMAYATMNRVTKKAKKPISSAIGCPSPQKKYDMVPEKHKQPT